MTTIDELLGNIQGNTWLGKNAFVILPDVNDTIENPLDWFMNLGAITYLKSSTGLNELPNLHKIVTSFNDDEISKIVKSVGVYFLESSYSCNLAFNSYKYNDLTSVAESEFAKTKEHEDEIKLLQEANIMNSFSLNLPFLSSQLFSVINTGLSTTFNIQERLEILEDGHLSFLENLKVELLDLIQNLLNAIGLYPKPKKCNAQQLEERKQLQKQLKSMRRRNRTVDDILSGNIQNKKQRQKQNYQQLNGVGASFVPSPNNTGIVKTTTGILTEIAYWLLDGFLNLSASIPPTIINISGLTEALANMAVSLVTKVLGVEGASALNYLVSAFLKTIENLLPNIWNPTGIFAGVWNFLMSFAPYIILTAVIIILAIKFTKKIEVGKRFYIIGVEEENVNYPDYLVAKYGGYTQTELLNLFMPQKEEFVKETGKNYQEIYGFSLDSTTIKASCILTGKFPVPLSKQEALRLWNERFSIVDDEGYFWTGQRQNIVYN